MFSVRELFRFGAGCLPSRSRSQLLPSLWRPRVFHNCTLRGDIFFRYLLLLFSPFCPRNCALTVSCRYSFLFFFFSSPTRSSCCFARACLTRSVSGSELRALLSMPPGTKGCRCPWRSLVGERSRCNALLHRSRFSVERTTTCKTNQDLHPNWLVALRRAGHLYTTERVLPFDYANVRVVTDDVHCAA